MQRRKKGLPQSLYGPLEGDYRFNLENYQTWKLQAKCRGLTPQQTNEIFFPNFVSPRHDRYKKARRYCWGCPVKTECLEAALKEERNMPNGFRAGKTPEQRSKIFLKQQKENEKNGK